MINYKLFIYFMTLHLDFFPALLASGLQHNSNSIVSAVVQDARCQSLFSDEFPRYGAYAVSVLAWMVPGICPISVAV